MSTSRLGSLRLKLAKFFHSKESIDKILSEKTDLTENVIANLRNKFLQMAPTGRLYKPEFIYLYCSLRPESNEKLTAIADYVFKAFDKDKNGFIDLEEFVVAYALTTRGSLQEKLKYAFEMYDMDDNGYLDREEIKCVLIAMFSLLDADRNKINLSKLVEQTIIALDTSRNGLISKDEFIKGLSENYSLRSIMVPFC